MVVRVRRARGSRFAPRPRLRVRGLNNFRGHFFRPGHTCFGLRDRGGQGSFSASGAPPQRGNWGANRGYSVLYSLKNAASRVKFPLIKTWRLNLLCTSHAYARPGTTHTASLEPGLPLQLAPRSGAEDFSCGDAVDVWPRRFRRGDNPSRTCVSLGGTKFI